MAKNTGIAFSIVYALGLVAVQAHLLRFAILDLSAIDVYYFLVGFWVLLCLLPGLAVLLLIEIRLDGHRPKLAKLVISGFTVGLFLSVSVWLLRFRTDQQILNFNAYPYPTWYPYLNVLWINLVLILLWILLFLLRRSGLRVETTRNIGICVAVIAILTFSVFFGRTIYPALDRGVGGGAPLLALLSTQGNTAAKPILLVHIGGESIYFIELDSLPVNVDDRRPSDHYVTDRSGPIYRALVQNSVVRLSASQIVRLTTLGFSQKAVIDRYLFKGKHILP